MNKSIKNATKSCSDNVFLGYVLRTEDDYDDDEDEDDEDEVKGTCS